jgi:hypothetical protein
MAMAELHLTDDASLTLVSRTSVLWVRVTD